MEDAVLREYFSKETFHKIFGNPKRQQFLSPDSYLFYYDCKDGLVQIKVGAKDLDDDALVLIIELNIL
jgi:hypothetical protein